MNLQNTRGAIVSDNRENSPKKEKNQNSIAPIVSDRRKQNDDPKTLRKNYVQLQYVVHKWY